MVGTSCRLDVLELLEKRVASRMSCRKELILEPGQTSDPADSAAPSQLLQVLQGLLMLGALSALQRLATQLGGGLTPLAACTAAATASVSALCMASSVMSASANAQHEHAWHRPTRSILRHRPGDTCPCATGHAQCSTRPARSQLRSSTQCSCGGCSPG